ncbi:MAG: hypothetical protein H0U49_09100, partial [Parachlamydiaceae bacterium]|nr:hypothetical protein [Parachlamydiaceae bacterium]
MQEAREELKLDEGELLKYGPKHANLVKQHHFVKSLGIQGVEVPLPFGIESNAIVAFLRDTKPAIFETWNIISQQFDNYDGKDGTPFLELSTVKKLLAEIDQEIKDAFMGLNQKRNDLISPEMTEWMESIDREGNYLMVRSSGDEDQQNSANAGGNISKAYVLPLKECFLLAVGDVVCSYFSANSLANRINAGRNPFVQNLNLAVTAQELIGEPIGGTSHADHIPISLVLFTCEPLYVGGESFRVMRLSASYGHGEGVVGNKGIACDTALILISETHPGKLYVLYDNQDKPERLAPIDSKEGIVLEKLRNPRELRKRPVLTPELLARLYHWGIVGEKFFDSKPADMEIVIKNNTIFPVQERPINRKPLLPTFLDLKKAGLFLNSPIDAQITAEMLVPGNASVLNISSEGHVLEAQTLAEAEELFDIKKHQLVITHNIEPVNSHPVVNFSGLGIPCLIVMKENVVKDLLVQVSPERPLVVCMQTAMIYLWNSSSGNVDAAITEGFAVHPAKIQFSLLKGKKVEGQGLPPQVPEDIKALLLNIRAAKTEEAALNVIKELKQNSWVTNIKQRKIELQRVLEGSQFPLKGINNAYETLDSLDAQIQDAFKEIKGAWKNKRHDERLRPLFHAKVLEALLVGNAVPEGTLCRYSLIDLEPVYAAAMELVSYQKALSHAATLAKFVPLGRQALTEDIQQQWISFLKELEPCVFNKE